MMRERTGQGELRARALYDYLLALPEGAYLPRLRDIGTALGFSQTATAYHAFNAFALLQHHREIDQVHGTVRVARGHRIVRIVATGRMMRTKDCPLLLPAAERR